LLLRICKLSVVESPFDRILLGWRNLKIKVGCRLHILTISAVLRLRFASWETDTDFWHVQATAVSLMLVLDVLDVHLVNLTQAERTLFFKFNLVLLRLFSSVFGLCLGLLDSCRCDFWLYLFIFYRLCWLNWLRGFLNLVKVFWREQSLQFLLYLKVQRLPLLLSFRRFEH